MVVCFVCKRRGSAEMIDDNRDNGDNYDEYSHMI